MGVTISEARYEEMPAQASNLRERAQGVNSQLTAVYNSLVELHNSWYGTRYNELLKEFNRIRPVLNDNLKILVGDMPYTLELEANNLSTVDRVGNVVAAQYTAPVEIAELSIPSDAGIRFLQADVESVQSDITGNFDTVLSLMGEIETICGGIVYVSAAGETMLDRFISIKNNIVTSIDEVKGAFTTLMNQTIEDVNATETANTIE